MRQLEKKHIKFQIEKRSFLKDLRVGGKNI